LATLDSASRAALPPLQLSMHVWNPDAASRFAIIDGQRLGEGGKVGSVVVAQIRRDGVVLDIAGRQFLLPRP
jgi:general secretion pathway protein B